MRTRKHEPGLYATKFTVLAVLFAAVLLVSFTLGRYSVRPDHFLKIMINRILLFFGNTAGFQKSWPDAAETIAINVRLPRITAAVTVGAALSTAGASYQGMFRNPMVSPDILGASTGAGFGAALGILMGFNYVGITISSFCFGLGAVFLAYLVSRVSRLGGTLSMVLSGIMIGSMFSAGTSLIKLLADTDDQLPAITYWLMGSLSSIRGRDAVFVLCVVVAGLIPLLLLRWRINLLTVSEEEAKSLGINTVKLRFVVIVCATLITAASVSVSGMIGWVGLVIPHFCRLVFGYDYRRVIPASILMGGAFLVTVDNLARILTTGELPLGVLTAFVGAPVFVWFIVKGGVSGEN